MVYESQKHQVSLNRSSCACQINRLLHQRQSYIFITAAQPFDNQRNSFIVYHIRLNDIETKRRYSEFASLRRILLRLYPIFIVPPIPEKHSLLDYAVLQNRAKRDITTIEKRKRMLQSFLNQVSKHPVLGHDHYFHQFLDPDVVWADVLESPSLVFFNKQQPLHMVLANAFTVTTQQFSSSSTLSSANPTYLPSCPTPWVFHPLLSHRIIPNPSSHQHVQQPDPLLVTSEQKSTHLANFMTQHVEKTQRKVIRRLGELANDYAELGAIYNGFSLNETQYVSNAIEKMGQTVDDAYTETSQMVLKLEGEFAEPLQSQIQMARFVKQVIHFQHLKQYQVELIEQALDHQQDELDRLLQMEEELQRLDQALQQPTVLGKPPPTIQTPPSPSPSPPPMQRRSSPPPTSYASRLWHSAGHSLQHLIDVDPVTTRRNQIGKSKESLQILEEALIICRNDVHQLSDLLHQELGRYEKDRTVMLRDSLLVFATAHLRYCQKNLSAWEDTKSQVDRIPLD